MRLLKKLFQKKEDKKEILLERSYPQAERYKGFKKVPMSFYGYEPIEKNMNLFAEENPKLNVKGKQILLQELKYGTEKNDICILVKIDGYHLGTVFYREDTQDFFKAFDKNKIEGIYFRFSDETIIGEEKGKIVEQTRIRNDLFALY